MTVICLTHCANKTRYQRIWTILAKISRVLEDMHSSRNNGAICELVLSVLTILNTYFSFFDLNSYSSNGCLLDSVDTDNLPVLLGSVLMDLTALRWVRGFLCS